MICGTFSTNVGTESEANVLVKAYGLTNPKPTVTKTKVTDPATNATTWTVTADYGPCPANTTHSTAGS